MKKIFVNLLIVALISTVYGGQSFIGLGQKPICVNNGDYVSTWKFCDLNPREAASFKVQEEKFYDLGNAYYEILVWPVDT